MRKSLVHLPVRWLLLAATIGLFGPVEAAWAQSSNEQVLVLYSTSRDAPMSVAGDRELARLLEQGLEGRLSYYSEYIDQGRFPQPGYQEAFSEFLRVKYKGQRFALVIAIQAAAVEFVGNYRNELFPDAPIVFLATSSPTRQITNSTGVVAELNLASTVSLATELQPDVRQVFIVSGTGIPDKEYERLARAQLQPFESRLNITYLSGLTTQDLEKRLAALPEHSIVYYLAVYQDGAGDIFSPTNYLERVVAAARAPTYTWSDALMGRGTIGGNLLDPQSMMQAVATPALRVLKGERADNIPTSSPDLHVPQVDWRQLRRWGIDEARVPAGTLIKFREPGVWDQYKFIILGALALVLVQSALIAGLLIQRVRRQTAEKELRGSQAALRSSYQRIRDLGARLLNAQETERARIARELHDDITQQMSLLVIDLALLRGDGQAKTLAQEAMTRVEGIIKGVRDLSHRLHPTKLRLIGLVAALRDLQHELTQADIPIAFTYDQVPKTLPPDITLCLFRVAQEALHNALKYSHAHAIQVHLGGSANELTLTIADDGVGFDIDAAMGKGLGLISMGERLEAISGTLKIRSRPGAGTTLEVRVPLSIVKDTETIAV